MLGPDHPVVGDEVERRADPARVDAGPLGVGEPVERELQRLALQIVGILRGLAGLPVDDRIVICKIDAIYALPAGSDGQPRFEVVDWKTGKAPKDDDDLERKTLQLALYRLAYSKWAGIDPSRISAAFYFVSDDRVIRPEHIDDEAELLARWRAAFA